MPVLNFNQHEWFVDRVKDILRHYVNGEWLSAIAFCECLSEFLTNARFETYLVKIGIDRNALCFFEEFRQAQRLIVLKKMNLIDEKEHSNLEYIRTKRNEYIHLNSKDSLGNKIKEDSLQCIVCLFDFLNSNERSIEVPFKSPDSGKTVSTPPQVFIISKPEFDLAFKPK